MSKHALVRVSIRRIALAAALPLALAACTLAGPTPEPEATLMAAPWTSVPITTVPTVDAAAAANAADVPAGPATATMDVAAFATQLSATIAALASPAPTVAPRVAVNTAVPIAGCAVPRTPPVVGVGLSPDAPESVRTWWSADDLKPRTFEGEVVASDDAGKSTRVRSSKDGATFEATITTDVALPLSPGRRVRVTWHDERPAMGLGGPGRGYGLYVGDDDGLVALIFASGWPLAVGDQLLTGERGGLTIQQLRSPCVVAELDCGFSLFAAPVQFARGAAALTLGPGESGALTSADGGPAYNVRVATSHVIVSAGAPLCSDWESWLLSYTVIRK